MLSVVPLASRLKAKIRRPPPLREAAAEVREIEPAATIECAPPIALPGEIERVSEFFGDPEVHIRRLNEAVREERPTLAYRLSEAVMADFTVYCGGSYEVYRPGHKRPILSLRSDEFEEAQLCTTSCVESYFGHFLQDGLPLELLAHQQGLLPLSFHRTPWLHEPLYRSLVGLQTVATTHARVRHLWICDETARNEGWVRRFGELRRRLRRQLPSGEHPHVFIARGRLGAARALVNESEIAAELESRGFRVIEPENMDVAAIGGALSNARVVVCLEGSAQDHAFVAMPPGATLLSIQPPHRFNSLPKLMMEAIGGRFAYVVADPAERGCYLAPKRLLQTLDLIPA